MYSNIVTLPLGHLRKWDDVPFIVPESTSYVEAHFVLEASEEEALDNFVEEKKFESRLLLILAKTYLLVQNRPAAEGCLRNCIIRNPYSKEAVQLALSSKLLSPEQIRLLLRQSTDPNNPVLDIIRLVLDYHNPQADLPKESQSLQQALSEDLSFKAAYASRLYNDEQIDEAYKVSAELVHKFGFYMDCFLIYVACLVELKKTNELYIIGHRLVELHSEREITWYTVGCYYYATGQFSAAKKFLNKCTTMNPSFGEGWLAFGHALSQDKEHEQAMNCYLRASRILDGCMEPTMYIGLEHCFANNLKLAWSYIQDLSSDGNSVPNAIVLHEQGTVAFLQRDFTKAESIFKKALRVLCGVKDQFASLSTLLAGNVNEYWEPLYNNLGHTLRKLEKYQDAIEVHTKSLRLTRNKSAAWSAIGVCYACMGSLNQAMDALNQALALNPHDELIRSAWERIILHTMKIPSTLFIGEEAEENLDKLLQTPFLPKFSKSRGILTTSTPTNSIQNRPIAANFTPSAIPPSVLKKLSTSFPLRRSIRRSAVAAASKVADEIIDLSMDISNTST
uniref:Uncharacterized protein n=1 Tax=Acrobeloides nanus TaxID=290746 RepID=A0A914CKR6_9BILA